MSKHHQYHPNQSGSYHTATKKTHLDHHHHDSEMIMMPSQHHGSNGLRPNGIINGDVDSNDSNNNHNKHHTHKRSAAGGGGGSGAETSSSSKRTKLSVPSDKSGKVDCVGGSASVKSHYNITEKLKELYKELKRDKSCKEVSWSGNVNVHLILTFDFIPAQSLAIIIFTR